MAFISQEAGYLFLVIFGIVMILITWFFARWKKYNTQEGFLVAGRNVNWFLGGTSIAASWIWAPALFISSQVAYENGLAGIFWFTLPNIIALAIFAVLAPRIRQRMPKGYTLPQYIKYRLNSTRLHRLYLFPYFFYQLMAVTVQLFAGGSLITLLTGIPLIVVMPSLMIIALAYTLISGLESSIVTDFIQIGLIVVIGAIVLPLTWSAAGGMGAITAGFSGINNIGSIFDPGVAFAFGVVTSIGLIAGAISDQQYWQRSFAIKKRHLGKAFIFGALLFGIIPIALSTLGFLGANSALSISLPAGIDASMIGVQAVATLLPTWTLFLFVIMLLAGLSSTLDSGLSATSALWATDVAAQSKNEQAVSSARYAMLGIAVLGLLLAIAINYIPNFGMIELWWVLNTISASVMAPTLLSLYWDKLSEKGAFWGIVAAFVFGVPAFVYANTLGNPTYIVGASVFIVLISTVFCVVMPRKTLWKSKRSTSQ